MEISDVPESVTDNDLEKNVLNLSSIGINSAFINDSLSRYYKNLWVKCKKFWLNKFIHGFWTSNESIRLKLTETSNVRVIAHDLEELFPGNELISDDAC